MRTNEKAAFWDKKILPWEESRYGESGFFYRRLFSGSVRARRQIALELLSSRVRGKTVLELGCGSGHLADAILALGARRYIGVDFSEVAISAARSRYRGVERVEFLAAGVGNLPVMDFDLCFSAGLLDWLEDDEILRLVTMTAERDFVHSFSEKRNGDFLRSIHARYVHLKYGRNQRSYVPRYLSENRIKEFFGSGSQIHRHPAMRFGAFVTRGIHS